ncbi:MAG: transporter substrate-binding domain-containing protein [Thiotrichaceae bacterium]|nr:transporter substrate-binding domain-containing protein [Thiotrichaceae bacterium]
MMHIYRVTAYLCGLYLLIATQIVCATNIIIVVRGNANFAPKEMTINGELTGFHIELIRETAKILNMQVAFKSVSWSRALQLVKDGDVDAISYAAKSTERGKYLYYFEENVLSDDELCFMGLASNKSQFAAYDGTLESISHFKIGIVRNFTYGDKFDNNSSLNKQFAENRAQIHTRLFTKHIDLTVVERNVFSEVYGNLQPSLVILTPPFLKNKNYLAFSKAHDLEGKLAKRFAEAMTSFKRKPEYQKLLEKYDLNE